MHIKNIHTLLFAHKSNKYLCKFKISNAIFLLKYLTFHFDSKGHPYANYSMLHDFLVLSKFAHLNPQL